MAEKKERDYVLGTNDEELQRLGLQHRVWRPTVLACWNKAGITAGSKVIDLGAGPGYATIDLAEIVGAEGKVVALERSGRYVAAGKDSCAKRGLTNVQYLESDLMTDELPAGPYDFSWCRWVLAFLPDPNVLLRKLHGVLRPGGTAIFYEYGWYASWSFAPPQPCHERFRNLIVQTWRESGGEPDIGLSLPKLLPENGFAVRTVSPHIFPIRPRDFMWQWPASFIETGLERLLELQKADETFGDNLRNEFARMSANPASVMLTPLVLEVVAEKRDDRLAERQEGGDGGRI